MKLISLTPQEIARRYAVKWLNRVIRASAPSQPHDLLPEDYLTFAEVLYSSGGDDSFMLIEMHTDDDGGSAQMFCHIVDNEIRWAAWYFDGTWGEMR